MREHDWVCEHQVSCFRARFGALFLKHTLRQHTNWNNSLIRTLQRVWIQNETRPKIQNRVVESSQHKLALTCSHCEWMSAVYFGPVEISIFIYCIIFMYLKISAYQIIAHSCAQCTSTGNSTWAKTRREKLISYNFLVSIQHSSSHFFGNLLFN